MKKLISLSLSLCLTVFITTHAFSMKNEPEDDEKKTHIRPHRTHEENEIAIARTQYHLSWSDLHPYNWHPLTKITMSLIIFNIGLLAYKYFFLTPDEKKCKPALNVSDGSSCEVEMFLTDTIRNATDTVCRYMMPDCAHPLDIAHPNSK